jgi:hypothetical protein
MAAKAFFPLDERLGIPENGITPRVQKYLLERLSEEDYRASADSLEVLGNSISPAAAGKLQREIGAQIHEERFGPQAALHAAQTAPANPAQLLIVSGDGARFRTNEADVLAETGKRRIPAADKSAEEQDRGWRENKVGVVIRAQKGFSKPDGTYQPPEELVKTYVATAADIRAFGHDLHTEAERRGIQTAREVVWISDHGHGLPEMRAREFPNANVVTDFFHCSERLGECARLVCGEGDAFKRPRQKFFHRLNDQLYRGNVEKVIALVRDEASKRAAEPECLSELDMQPDAKILWTHVFYFQKHQHTMNYSAYRAKGWPIGSGAIESACGQFGNRFKHGRMRWTKTGAEAGHQIKAAILSQDGQWDRRWPAPIPALDLAAAS